MSEWKMVRIGDFCSISKGNIGITKAIPGKYTLVTTADKRLSHNEYAFSKPAVIIPLVSGTGHGHASINRIHYQDGKFSVGSILCVVTPKDSSKLNANFLYHFLDVFKEELLVRRMRGMANVTLPIKAIAEIEFPLLSIEQQQHWVNLLNRTSQNTSNISTQLTHQKSLLKKLRQSILQDAVSGKLTEQWRKDNPVTESAVELLKRIETEKAELLKSGKIKKQKPLPPVKAEEIPFELPESWVWCRTNDTCEAIVDCPHSTPQFIDFGFNCIDTNCFGDEGKITQSRYVSEFTFHERNRRIIPQLNDIIYSREGIIGQAVILPADKNYCLGQRVMLFRPCKYFEARLFRIIITSPFFKNMMIKNHKGMGAKHVNMSDLVSGLIPLPPLTEQQTIVAKVEALLKHCDQLAAEITASELHAQMLLQTVLKEAFNPA